MASSGPTANYGWTKPVVGGDGDAWGDEINTDLDGIDATVKGVSNAIPAASSTPPIMDGTAAVGTGATFARADHVHPSDTTKYAASNPSGFQTAAQVTASLVPYALTTAVPAASTTTPAMDAAAAVGAGTTWARADHVHPSDTSRLALIGGTMAGPLTLATDPAANLQSATKQYVDGGRLGDNRLINGDMRIDQRNGGVSGTAINIYMVDRWQFPAAQAAKLTWGQNLNAVAGPVGFPYYLGFQSSSAYTALAGDNFTIQQPIEADMVSDFAWGTASAQPITLSFWTRSSLTGAFSGSITNGAGTRSYPFSFAIPTANTWTQVVLTIPGDTSGAWVMKGNGGALTLDFDLGSGANFRSAANAWSSGWYFGVTGAVRLVSTNGATFYVTGVKLEIGSVATPYNRQSLAKNLADCQRYFTYFDGLLLGGYSNGSLYSCYTLPVTMRAIPTVIFSNQVYLNSSGLAYNGSGGKAAVSASLGLTTTGVGYCTFNAAMSAEL